MAAPLTPCACLGARNGEPHCNCVMERLNLPRSPEHVAESERIEREMKALLPHLFGGQMEGGAA